MEVSAKTAYQVQDAFKKNAELIIDKIENGKINLKNEPPGIKIGNAMDKPTPQIELQNQSVSH